MLTEENVQDLERIQKCSLKIILEDKYKNYQNALNITEMDTLFDRREALCKNFALKNVKNVKMKKHFIRNTKAHEMETRESEPYKVNFAHTERLRKSPVIYMQKLLNQF